MTITGIFGEIGSGKSWFQMQQSLEMAEKKIKRLVTNFPINLDGLYSYCRQKKYYFLVDQIDKGGIIYINPNSSLADILRIPQSIVCLDEAGVFLNAREFASTPKELLADLAQSRKEGTDLIYAAQFPSQIDKQMRELTQFVAHCEGVTKYNKEKRRPELIIKNYHLFTRINYERWYTSRARFNPIKTRFAYALHSNTGALTIQDGMLFNVFDSLAKIDDRTGRKRKTVESIKYQRGKYLKRAINLNNEEETEEEIEEIDDLLLFTNEGRGLILSELQDDIEHAQGEKLSKEEIRGDDKKKSLMSIKNEIEEIIPQLEKTFTLNNEEDNTNKSKKAKPRQRNSRIIIFISQGNYYELTKKWEKSHYIRKIARFLYKTFPQPSKEKIDKIIEKFIKINNKLTIACMKTTRQKQAARKKLKENKGLILR